MSTHSTWPVPRGTHLCKYKYKSQYHKYLKLIRSTRISTHNYPCALTVPDLYPEVPIYALKIMWASAQHLFLPKKWFLLVLTSSVTNKKSKLGFRELVFDASRPENWGEGDAKTSCGLFSLTRRAFLSPLITTWQPAKTFAFNEQQKTLHKYDMKICLHWSNSK